MAFYCHTGSRASRISIVADEDHKPNTNGTNVKRQGRSKEGIATNALWKNGEQGEARENVLYLRDNSTTEHVWFFLINDYCTAVILFLPFFDP